MSRRAQLASPEPLDAGHELETFDCGDEALNAYLKRYAIANQRAGAARTYVAPRDRVVIGYYSLAAGSVELRQAPARVAKGLARHPVPVTLLARLAVDRRERGEGIGASLLRDALLRHLQTEAIIGSRALLVHAKTDEAASFYARFGFEPSPTDPRHLFLLTKDIRRTLSRKS